ncbi:MAG: tetratricopeptide repeat protein, partial [marine benthic group bacterium]|nr:tetratricopeptide repeat protein [Gemmatimonadota bacterium]
REGERRLLLYQGRASPAAAGVLKLPEDEMREIRDELASDEPSLKGHVGFAPPTEVQFVRYHFLGLISARLGDIDGARAYADSLEELPDRADVGDGRVPPADEVVPLAQDLALEVRAQVLVEQGRLEEALGLLERQTFGAISEGDDSGLSTSRTFGRFLRAEILRERGRYEEAVGWYATIPRVKMWHQQDVLLHAPVFRGRAQALDALGRHEEALHYYRRFVTRWQDADPHLQPQVEESRQRIRELERELN